MHDYVVADVFTDEPLTGNPVAVFLEAADIPPAQMQRLARELNLSETTFVLPPQDGGDVRVRIFTPVNELPFAGHPTLGTAIVLGTVAAAAGQDRLLMETAMGTVPFELDRGPDGRIRLARMWQPVPTWEAYPEAEELLDALGVKESVLPVEVYRNGPRHVFVGVDSVAALSEVRPDLRALSGHRDMAANCFALSGDPAEGHLRMRMFSPAYGVAEDAATGSAAGPLAVHLARHGRIPFGRRIEIRQGVEMGRPSTMLAVAEGTGQRVDRVEVAGSAVIVARGTFRV